MHHACGPRFQGMQSWATALKEAWRGLDMEDSGQAWGLTGGWICKRRKCLEGAEGPDKGSQVEVAGIHKWSGWGQGREGQPREAKCGCLWGRKQAGRCTKQEEEGNVARRRGFEEGGSGKGSEQRRGPMAPACTEGHLLLNRCRLDHFQPP